MKDSLYDRLWRRECGELSPTAGLRGIYGSKEWIDDLDIVNELGGHTGCVNALRYVAYPRPRLCVPHGHLAQSCVIRPR